MKCTTHRLYLLLAGTFSDGYRDPTTTILKRARELHAEREKLEQSEQALRTAQERLHSMSPMNKEYSRYWPCIGLISFASEVPLVMIYLGWTGCRISTMLDSQKHNLSLLEAYANQSGFQKEVETAQNMEAEIQSSEEQLVKTRTRILQLEDHQKVKRCGCTCVKSNFIIQTMWFDKPRITVPSRRNANQLS